MNWPPFATVIGFGVCFLNPVLVFAQGALAPLAPPAPLYKTLDQIEPRTPISAAITIDVPGSYYLTQNVIVATGNAITINTSNVTLDLNGFTISSSASPASGSAVNINNGFSNITITNGNVNSGVGYSDGNYTGTGFANGINVAGATNNVCVRGVNVFGVLSGGLNLGLGNTTVEGCTVTIAGDYGIYANSVADSTAVNTGKSGIFAQVALNCTGNSNGNNGVHATTATNCQGTASGTGNAGSGVFANSALNCFGVGFGTGPGVNAWVATNCWGQAVSSSGILAHTAAGCQGMSTSGEGVTADDANGCEGTSTSADGIHAATANNCFGQSTSGTAVSSNYATGCRAISTTGPGIIADHYANGCWAKSSGHNVYAIQSPVAINCYGEYDGDSGQSFAIYAFQMAIGCNGVNNRNAALGLYTPLANSCVGSGINATNKYNMP